MSISSCVILTKAKKGGVEILFYPITCSSFVQNCILNTYNIHYTQIGCILVWGWLSLTLPTEAFRTISGVDRVRSESVLSLFLREILGGYSSAICYIRLSYVVEINSWTVGCLLFGNKVTAKPPLFCPAAIGDQTTALFWGMRPLNQVNQGHYVHLRHGSSS
jgi:hypothetical protein